jgi:Lrp/AsnC family transcriptional regulator, leucine-responsive regulatory protein
MTFDAIDIRILQALQENGRQTNLELANRIGLSPSPCLRRVRRLEEDGVIAGYAALINRERVGLGVMAFVRVNIERHRETDADRFMKQVGSLKEVISVYITSGESDFLLQVVVADLDEYRKFALEKLIRISGVKDITSSFVIGTVKEVKSLPLAQPQD